MRDQARQKEEDFKNLKDRIQKKQKCIKISLGLTQTAIFLLFIIFQIMLVVNQRNVVTSYWSQYSSQTHLLDPYPSMLQFANNTQLFNFIKN